MGRQVLVWSGLREYERTLRQLPAVCIGEAVHEIEAVTNATAVDIRRAYPYRTGNLRRGVLVSRTYRTRDGAVVGATLSSSAPHSHLYEYGTKDRAYTTKVNGVVHHTGAGTRHVTFVPAVNKARRELIDRLKAIIRRQGATSVVGD